MPEERRLARIPEQDSSEATVFNQPLAVPAELVRTATEVILERGLRRKHFADGTTTTELYEQVTLRQGSTPRARDVAVERTVPIKETHPSGHSMGDPRQYVESYRGVCDRAGVEIGRGTTPGGHRGDLVHGRDCVIDYVPRGAEPNERR
jgi:hypothetical protein